MDSLNLKTLIEVARTGSFSKAADNLFVTQSAVSRRIKYLEEEFGYPLLDRSGSTMKPTEAGKMVIEKAKKMLALEETLLRQLESLNESPHIALACTRPFGIIHLPTILKSFMKKYRQLADLKISFEMPYQALQGLQENRLDLAVLEHWEILDLSGFTVLPLPGDEMVFAGSPSLALSGPLVSVDELVRQRLYRRKVDCCSWKFLTLNLQMIGRDIAEFTDTAILDDLHVIMESLINGDGIALISRDLVRKHLESGALCEHRVAGFNHQRQRSLVIADSSVPHMLIADLVACIFDSLGLEPPDLRSCRS